MVKQWRKNRRPGGQCVKDGPAVGPGVDLNRFMIISLQGVKLDVHYIILRGVLSYVFITAGCLFRCLDYCRPYSVGC